MKKKTKKTRPKYSLRRNNHNKIKMSKVNQKPPMRRKKVTLKMKIKRRRHQMLPKRKRRIRKRRRRQPKNRMLEFVGRNTLL